MEHRYLGSSGMKVSELALGGWTFGREADEAESFRMLSLFAEAGGTLIDTAPGYNDGRSEDIIGRWLRRHPGRDAMLIATKVYGRTGDGSNAVGLSRRHVVASLDASLDRLGLGHVDLLQTHFWDRGTPLEETLSVLDDAVRSGKARYLGASNYLGWQLAKAAALTTSRSWQTFISIQPEYSLLARDPEWEIIPAALDGGMGVLPWSPLGGGWLTGKHAEVGPAQGTRVTESALPWQPDSWDARDSDHTWRVIAAVKAIAQERAVPAAQVALNWLRKKSFVTAPIIGARNCDQLTENLGCLDWELDAEAESSLDHASAPPRPSSVALIAHVNDDDER
jgi:aryl-alcohol dehydrogenase-like predicted oxidoreductase